MNPHILQQKIHSTFSTGQAVWSSFKDEILAELINVGEIRVARDHLLREFNRKVIHLGLNDLPFSPYDGGYRFIGADLNAEAYISAIEIAGATVTEVQRIAINNFVIGEKVAGRWTSHKRLYLPIWGVAAANAICMRSLTSGTFVGGVTHAAGYVQGNGSTGYFNTGVSLEDVGVGVSSAHLMVLNNLASTGLSRFYIGANQGSAIARIQGGGTSSNGVIGDSSSAATITSNRQGIWVANRLANNNFKTLNRKTSGVLTTNNSVTVFGVPDLPLFVLCNNQDGTPASYMVAEIGVVSFGLSVPSPEDYSSAVKTLWETCTGLTLP